MEKGIIYIASTVVDGLIKIGKCQSGQYESRMYQLEHNGYCNVTGLKRKFAIEVDGYDEKENLLHTIFNKSRVGDTELFCIDSDLAIQLLSAFEGTIIYPKQDKEEIFDEATNALEAKNGNLGVNRHNFKEITFYSSLTGKKYDSKTNSNGSLGIYEHNSGIEVANFSNPSKKQIIRTAILDLGEEADNSKTLYQLMHQLQKIKH